VSAGPLRTGPVWEALAGAAREVGRDTDGIGADAASPEEAAAAAESLLTEVLTTSEKLPDNVLVPSALARRALILLRRRFLERMADPPSTPPAGELLEAFRALDRVERRLQPAWDQRFHDRLSGHDGLELVVEVAHDLRSPLTSILFLAETLLRGRSGPVTPLQERQLGLVYSAAFGLSAVTSDMVELVRGRERVAEPDPMPFSINEILESVRDIVRPIAEEKGLEIRIGYAERPFRRGHQVALNRVLLNLTTNALKFTEEGWVEIAAREAEEGGEVVEFSVQDTGRGIPTKAMALLFEPFRRRQRDGEYAFSGSGLGLSICRKFVETMGSELRVETELGAGTRFSFALELAEPSFGEPLAVSAVSR